MFRVKGQQKAGLGLDDTSVSGQVSSIPDVVNLEGYLRHLGGSFNLPAHEMSMFTKTAMELGRDSVIGKKGSSTTLFGNIDESTCFYTVIHIIQDYAGFTVSHAHHTEKSQGHYQDANFLKASAMKDLERLGVRDGEASYKPSQPKTRLAEREWEEEQQGCGAVYIEEDGAMNVDDARKTINSQSYGDRMLDHSQPNRGGRRESPRPFQGGKQERPQPHGRQEYPQSFEGRGQDNSLPRESTRQDYSLCYEGREQDHPVAQGSRRQGCSQSYERRGEDHSRPYKGESQERPQATRGAKGNYHPQSFGGESQASTRNKK